MADDKRKHCTTRASAFGKSVFGGNSPNDLVTPAWNAVAGDDSNPRNREGKPNFCHSGTASPPMDSAADDREEPIGTIDLAAVPDADDIAANSPVDPAAPLTEVVNGTDLLNGAGADDPDDDFRRVDNRERV